jgi:hypothetical protein
MNGQCWQSGPYLPEGQVQVQVQVQVPVRAQVPEQLQQVRPPIWAGQ